LGDLAEAYRPAVLVGRQGEVVEALGRGRSRPVERGSRDGLGLARQRGIVETNEAGVSLETKGFKFQYFSNTTNQIGFEKFDEYNSKKKMCNVKNDSKKYKKINKNLTAWIFQNVKRRLTEDFWASLSSSCLISLFCFSTSFCDSANFR
jgi:hypothetical protein